MEKLVKSYQVILFLASSGHLEPLCAAAAKPTNFQMNNLLCISNTYELALRYLSYAHLFKKSYFYFDIWESFLTFESLVYNHRN